MNAVVKNPEAETLWNGVDTEREQPLRICFVCTGNTCRSPMAVANAIVHTPEFQRTSPRPIEAYSAGLYAVAGDPISSNALLALERAGIQPDAARDYRKHRAHTLTQEEAERYDLLVGISDGHAMELILRFPSLASRVTAMDPPVSDPYGGDLARYEHALGDIITGVRNLLNIPNEDTV